MSRSDAELGICCLPCAPTRQDQVARVQGGQRRSRDDRPRCLSNLELGATRRSTLGLSRVGRPRRSPHSGGNDVRPGAHKGRQQGLLNRLTHVLSPVPRSAFLSFQFAGLGSVVLEVGAATTQPVVYSGKAHIRVGEHTKERR